MEVRDLFETLEYGPAPEDAGPARQWLADRNSMLDHFIGGEWATPESGNIFHPTTRPRRHARHGGRRQRGRCQPGGCSRGRCAGRLGRDRRTRPGAVPVRDGQAHPEEQPPVHRAGKPGQRQTGPRIRDIDIPLVARHFYHHAGWAQLMQQEMPAIAPSVSWARSFPGIFPC